MRNNLCCCPRQSYSAAPTSPSLMFRYTFFCLFVPWANRKLTFVQTSDKLAYTYWHILPSPVAVILFLFYTYFSLLFITFCLRINLWFLFFSFTVWCEKPPATIVVVSVVVVVGSHFMGEKATLPQSLYQDPCAPIALKVVCCVLKWLPPASSRATNRRRRIRKKIKL